MASSLSSYLHFLWAGLIKRGQTGAIVPSQKFLIERMISPIPESYTGRIVELGCGSGVLTRRLAQRCPAARIIACEINPVLADDAETLIRKEGLGDRVQVVVAPAQQVLARFAAMNGARPKYIISGIPLAPLEQDRTQELIGAIHAALAPGGMYIQFQHSLLDRKNIVARFSETRTVPVLLNIPPAVVYYAGKH